jgi:hypothetical protein
MMKKTLLTSLVSLLSVFGFAQVDCNIAHMQGGFDNGYLGWSPGDDALYAFIDPAQDYGIGQGCGATYPYTIETVNFNLATSVAFGQGGGIGTFQYAIGIYSISGADPCNEPGAELANSGAITVELNGAGITPQEIAFDLEVSDAFFVSYEIISWTGPANQVPTILWDAVPRPNCTQFISIDGGATFLDHSEFFLEGDIGWFDFTIFGSSETGNTEECDAGMIVDATDQDLCPGEGFSFDIGGSQTVPVGTGYGIYFVPTTGTGALDGDFVLTGVTPPYNIDSDLNGILSANEFPEFEGEWEVYGVVYESAADPIGTNCSTTENFVLVNFLTEDDPLCGGVEPGDECLTWVSPTPTTGWTDFTTIHGGAPCNDGDGCPFLEIEDFEVWKSEAYAMENIQEGAEYTFSHCNGPGAGSWIPEYTIIAPSGAVDAFGAGDGDGCSITWTATEDGTYLIVINEAGSCGVAEQVDNGFPAITCSGMVECPDLGNAVCEEATPVSEGQHTYEAIVGVGAANNCFDLGLGANGARWFVYTPTADGFVNVKACGQVDTRLSIYTGDCDNLTCYADNDDDGDTDCHPNGWASSVMDMPVTAGVDYYIEWDDRWSAEGSDWEITFTPPPVCDAPTATAAIDFSECPSPLFNVLVDLTGIGDATSVDIVESVNGGADNVVHSEVTMLQEYVMGPYAMGESVVVTVIHNEDVQCNINLGTFTAAGCPPENDTCTNANPITCGETLSGTNVNATPYAGACVGNNAAGGVWYSFVGQNSDDPGAEPGTAGDQVTMSTCEQTNYDTKIDVLTGSCMELVCVGGNDDAAGCGVASEITFPTLVGETYYVFVSGFSAFSSGTFDLTMTCGPACLPTPDNDLCENAEMLTIQDEGTGTPTIGSNVCATSSLDNPSCNMFATIQDVWYTFNSGDAVGAALIAAGLDMTDLRVVVYEGSCDGDEILCQNPFNSPQILSLMPNTDYYVQVYSNGPAGEGAFEIMLETIPPPPANDECANAITVDCESVTTGITTFATTAGAPDMCGTTLDTAPGVWYTVEGIDGSITASLCNSDFDTKIGIFSGSCGELVCIVGEDDDFANCDGPHPHVTWSANEGDIYYIYVTGFGSNTGAYELVVECDDSPPTDECTDWVEPTPTTGWTDFNGLFGGAPCNDGDGCPFNEITAFEVWQSEAYAMDNIQEGGVYTFSHCNGPGAGSWVPEYTIIAPSGAIDAFGEGDGDACSITWTATESGTYLIVINEAGACGIAGNTDNGFPAITCDGVPECEPSEGCEAEIPYDEEEECVQTVIANDPFCCETEWDDQCESAYQACLTGGDCLSWVSPSPETGWGDFTTIFEGAPTPDEDGNCDFFEILDFQVWQSEAYEMENIQEGVSYTFSHCNGASGSWTPTYVIVAPSGAIDAEGLGDGDGCSITWVASESGTYLIGINDVDNCGVPGQTDNGFPAITCDGTTSVDEIASMNFSVFPNPNNGQFVLEYSGDNGMAHIDVINVSGKVVHAQQMMMNNNSQLDIDLGNNVNGMYFVRVTMDNDVKVIKVVVQ